MVMDGGSHQGMKRRICYKPEPEHVAGGASRQAGLAPCSSNVEGFVYTPEQVFRGPEFVTRPTCKYVL